MVYVHDIVKSKQSLLETIFFYKKSIQRAILQKVGEDKLDIDHWFYFELQPSFDGKIVYLIFRCNFNLITEHKSLAGSGYMAIGTIMVSHNQIPDGQDMRLLMGYIFDNIAHPDWYKKEKYIKEYEEFCSEIPTDYLREDYEIVSLNLYTKSRMKTYSNILN